MLTSFHRHISGFLKSPEVTSDLDAFVKDRTVDPTLNTEPVAGMNANIIMVNSPLTATQSDKQTGDTHANLIIRVEITAILLSCCSQYMRSRHPEPTHD
jgi:hypothetical protein